MFCPGCGAEYEPGVTTCAECQVELVAEAPDVEPHFQDTVNVFESDDPGEIALAESLLQGAEIPYVVQNATGRSILGPAITASVEVKPEFVETAAELLADLNEGIPAEDIDEYYDDDEDDEFDEEDGDEEFTEESKDE